MRKKGLEREKIKIVNEAKRIIGKVIRGTYIEWYQECSKEGCRCHKDKKNWHGPFKRISYSKGGRVYHIYIRKEKKELAKRYVRNYKKLCEAIEKISHINIQLLKIENGRKK